MVIFIMQRITCTNNSLEMFVLLSNSFHPSMHSNFSLEAGCRKNPEKESPGIKTIVQIILHPKGKQMYVVSQNHNNT